jgi:molecular chaperone DnaK (HSP70)
MIHVGIDLGTSNCCITYVDESGVPHVLTNPVTGEYLIPSAVAVDKDKTLYGSVAVQSDACVLTNFKRLIGHSIDDEEAQRLADKLGLHLVASGEDVAIDTPVGALSVVQLTAMLLRHLGGLIHAALGDTWTCVVTVPAYFNEVQRKATWKAIQAAGIPCTKMLSEPTSACLAYLHGSNTAAPRKVLVVDFGAGTLDLTLMQVGEAGLEVCEVLAVYGDNTLGGVDITRAISDRLDVPMREAELIKIARGESELSEAELDAILDATVRPRLLAAIDAVLDIGKASVDEVVLVGGTCKMPWVRRTVADHLAKPDLLSKSLLLDDKIYAYEDVAVSLGAALHGQAKGRSDALVLIDRLPLSIGVEAAHGTFVPIIPRNSVIPLSVTKTFTTDTDDQDEVTIDVFQGESRLATENVRIGTFVLSGIQPAPKGVPVIYISVRVDANGIVEVTAKERRGTAHNTLRINNTKELVDDEVVARLLEHFERNRERDNRLQQLIELYYSILDVLQKANYHVNYNPALLLDADVVAEAREAVCEALVPLFEAAPHVAADAAPLHALWKDNADVSKEPPVLHMAQTKLLGVLREVHGRVRKAFEVYLIQTTDQAAYEEAAPCEYVAEDAPTIDPDAMELRELVHGLLGNLDALPLSDAGKGELKRFLEAVLVKGDEEPAEQQIDRVNAFCEEVYARYAC